MFSFLSSKRSRCPMRPVPRRPRPGATVEGLEGRIHFTFNAYIAGLRSGSPNVSASFDFSTTGQAAKSWDINWGDNGPHTILTAPDPSIGFTAAQT